MSASDILLSYTPLNLTRHQLVVNISANQTTSPADADFTLYFYYVLWTFVTPAIFGLITIVGTCGNTLVIYVIMSREDMQNATNLLLLNLAFSNTAFLITCVPLTAYRYAASTWPFGDTMCKLVSFLIYVTAYVTVYTLVAVSVLRYMTVVHGMRTAQYRTKRNVVVLIALVWLAICLVNVPSLFTHQLKVFDKHFTYCGMRDESIKPFFMSFFAFGYALPLVLICLLYVIILRHLHASPGACLREHTRDRTLHASKVIIAVIVVFMLSWLPLHVNQLWSAFGRLPGGLSYEVFRILCNSMAYGNSCCNPVILYIGSQDFRNAFRETVCCGRVRHLASAHNHISVRRDFELTEKTAIL